MIDRRKKLRNRQIIVLALNILDILLISYAIYALIAFFGGDKYSGLNTIFILFWNIASLKLTSVLCTCKHCGTKISTRELLKRSNMQCSHCEKDMWT